jgi:hypothetical protein
MALIYKNRFYERELSEHFLGILWNTNHQYLVLGFVENCADFCVLITSKSPKHKLTNLAENHLRKKDFNYSIL